MAKKESKRVKTLKSFMEWAEQFNDGEYVFRGVSNEKYIIEASTYRRLKDKDGNFKKQGDGTPEKLLKINEEMIEDAHRQGHGTDMKDLELLAELQHRGAATCLIDFTQNPLVALWMACREGSGGAANGKVFAVDISSQVTFEPVTSELSQEKNIDYFFTPIEDKGYQLYQWQPNYQKNRMLAQQSIFLFGGGRIEPAAECVILKNGKQNIRNSLEKSAGITEGNLFPDFDGFASQRAQNKAYIEPDARYYLLRGFDAYREGKVEEAIGYYTQGISLKPDKQLLALLHLSRASVYYARGEEDSAIKDCSTATELNPDLAEAYYIRGILYRNKGASDSAIRDYSRAIELNPDFAEAYNSRGAAKSSLERYDEAISDYDEVIRLDPNNAGAYRLRGLAKSELGQHDEAISNYDKAIELAPDEAGVYNNRGNAKSELGQHDEAISDFDKAIELVPDEAGVYNNRGNAKSKLGQHNEAISDLDKAIELAPDDARIYNNRGNAKSELGQHDEAISDFDKAIELAPDEAGVYNNRGNAKSELGQHDEAISDFDKAIELAPDEAGVYNNRGNAKSELGQHDEAISDFDKAIELAPDDVIAYYNRGEQKSKMEELSDAKQDFQTALQLAEKTGNADLVAEIKIELDKLESINIGNDSKDK